MVGVALLALSLVVPQNAPIGKIQHGPKVVFRASRINEKTNEIVLEPMLPTQIFGIISSQGGEQPKVGDIFNCKTSSKSLGRIMGDDGKPSNSTSQVLILNCGKYVFFIEGINFSPED